MRDTDALFIEPSLHDQLYARTQQISAAVDGLDKNRFLVSSDHELVDYFEDMLKIDPINLHIDLATSQQIETQIDVTADGRRGYGRGGGGRHFIPGTRLDVTIPFSGESWIFKYRTNPYYTTAPRAKIEKDNIIISVSLPHHVDKSKFKNEYERKINLIQDCVRNSSSEILAFNRDLLGRIQQAILERRKRLASHDDLSKLLDIPLAPRPGAPSPTPVRLEVRRPPKLPVPPREGVRPEPGLQPEQYEHILSFIRHQGRTYERTPATYSKHGEEELRDIMLAQLNGQFLGQATGESFRGRGKTDICIEVESRAAFVGECKVWTGAAGFKGAADQLLSYLTWRDCKAALIMFNVRNKGFSGIVGAIPAALQEHPLFVRDLGCSESGEWRVLMRSKDDEGRRVTVHVFAFDLFQGT